MLLSTASYTPIAWNAAAAELFMMDATREPLQRNTFWRILFDDRLAVRRQGSHFGAIIAGILRRATATVATAETFALVDELLHDDDFRAAWERYAVEATPTAQYFLDGGNIEYVAGDGSVVSLRPFWLAVQDQPEYLLSIYAPARPADEAMLVRLYFDRDGGRGSAPEAHFDPGTHP
jgi:hypothetical protein